MRTLTGLTMTAGLLVLASLAAAQRPGSRGGPPDGDGPGAGSDDLVTRMMAYDKDGDGKLARAEVGDQRLHRLFDRADADKDGTVTRAELTALAAKEAANDRGRRGFGGGPGGGPPGFQGPPPPRPGEVLSPGLQQRLRLTAEQKSKLADLQKEVNARLETILDDDQRQQLKDMRERGPGGPGGFGPPGGGRGRPGGDRPPPPRDERP